MWLFTLVMFVEPTLTAVLQPWFTALPSLSFIVVLVARCVILILLIS